MNVEIDCYDVKSYLPDDNGTGVSFDVLCNSAARARAGAFGMAVRQPLLLQQCPWSRVVGAVRAQKEKSPKTRAQASRWLGVALCARAWGGLKRS